MRQLLPEPLLDVDPFSSHARAERPQPPGRPWVLLNMVASADGATALHGVSGGLGGDADRATFRAIRAVADVILVAAGTVRTEGYGPPRPTPEVRAQRIERGQAPIPRLAVVTGSLHLDPTAALFAEATEPPLVLTTERADAERRDDLEAVAEVRSHGAERVDLAHALRALHDGGARVVVCEGGPSLNGQLLAADLVDELDLTTSPLLVGGDAARAAIGQDSAPRRMRLAHLWHDPTDDLLLARYVRST